MKLSFKQKPSANVIKIALAVLATANLAALFLFDYGLPDYSFDEVAAEASTEDQTAAIRFESNTLTYDGTGDIDRLLMNGVSAVDTDGSDITENITTSMKNGSILTEKTIKYSVKTSDGQKIKKERTLRLENYEGPSIQISSNLPPLEESELANSAALLADAGALHAEDGFGNDITSSVDVQYIADETSIGTYVLTFSLTNQFQDYISEKASIKVKLSSPVIALTRREVTISVNGHFDAMDYVREAVDTDGSKIDTKLIDLSGYVVRDTPGVYEVTYFVTGPESGLYAEATLMVTVQEEPEVPEETEETDEVE